MNPADLHVIAVISNPVRYQSRFRLYREFERYVAASGATLWTVEVAHGERAHSVADPANPRHICLRSPHEIWLKENMANVALAHLSRAVPGWRYVAFVDADVTFARPDWATETLHQLQHYAVVQMFSVAHDLCPNHVTFQTHRGFAASYLAAGGAAAVGGSGATPPARYESWHPGYAWAWRREALDAVGGFFDLAALGSGDRHMAEGLIGCATRSLNARLHPNYRAAVGKWQARAERHIRRNLGFVPGALLHYWHGRKAARGYRDRWKILVDHRFDPLNDLKRDSQGLYQLVDHGTPRSLALRDGFRAYFRSRNEDGVDL